MSIETQRYARKPLYVDAVLVTQENMLEVSDWCGGEIKTNLDSSSIPPESYILVDVERPLYDRQKQAFVGDWVLHMEKAGFKVYTEKGFENAFLKVEEPNSGDELSTPVIRDAQIREVSLVSEEPNPAYGVYPIEVVKSDSTDEAVCVVETVVHSTHPVKFIDVEIEEDALEVDPPEETPPACVDAEFHTEKDLGYYDLNGHPITMERFMDVYQK